VRLGLIAVAAILAGACQGAPSAARHRTVACLGDSNTMADWPIGPRPRWCEYAARALPEATFANHGFGGATACEPARLPAGFPWAMPQLAAARAERPDVVVAAFGTNDVQVLHAAPATIVACYRALVATAAPARVLVATTPPMYPPMPDWEADVAAVNAALHAAFPPEQLIDFHDGFPRALFLPDGIHLNDAGQRERARRVVAALRRLP
jgi:lysophospholipase L1-like esterase